MSKNNRLNGTGRLKQQIEQDEKRAASLYNYSDMTKETESAIQGFAKRLFELRTVKNVSAREMSLSLGQGAGYVNNIENGNNLPSMTRFFEICAFLEISPAEFFAYTSPMEEGEVFRMIAKLPQEDKELIAKLIEKLGRE